MKLKIILSLFFLSLANYAWTEEMKNEKSTYQLNSDRYLIYHKTRPFTFITNIPRDISLFTQESFQKKKLKAIAVIALSTGILIYYDQKLYDGAREIGNDLGIQNEDGTRLFVSIGEFPVFRGPTDLGSWLYYLGDGWLHIAITGSFYAYGKIGSDVRARQTSFQLLEGLGITSIGVQLIKHITGRESPNVSTTDRGRWDFLPNQIEYHKRVSSYDAFPSGHLATAMMTLTVISENYPEYNKIILPLGYTLIALLGFQMVNNGVHWASDYPLAIAMGYSFGKIVANNYRTVVNKEANQESFSISPIVLGQHGLGLGLKYKF